jgi:hypothetical protein
MIEPTVGRIVHYRPPYAHDAPLAAIVAGVHTPRSVNLLVVHDDGSTFPALEVVLLQDDDSVPEGEPYAEWMPFQKGQAPASSAVEERLKKLEEQSAAGTAPLEERLAAIEEVLTAGGPLHQTVSSTQQMVEQVHQRLVAIEQANAPKPEEPPQGQQSAGQQQS